ncbi:MAG: hypothetical protein LW847_04685, partial [Burkholderiales bacterium]|nr:hypothetical protein [Burkholderiales bacterium]
MSTAKVLTFSIDADNTALAHLAGPLDANLRQIETELDVRIARRGAQFRIAGAREPKPIRVRNIFICSGVVFCASSRITKALFSVRP